MQRRVTSTPQQQIWFDARSGRGGALYFASIAERGFAMRRIVSLGLVLLGFCLPPAMRMAYAAGQSVDVALVLADDVSGSINDDEFALQKKGWAAAFTDPQVISAIEGGPVGAIAVKYLEFAGSYEVKNVIDWTIIHDAASAKAFVQALTDAPRSFRGRTAIGEGIALATQDLAESGLEATRKVIDVCGDGTNNSGREVTDARDAALKQGIAINGLAIANESPIPWLEAHTHPPGGLDNYYRQNVTGGEESFVLKISSYESFADAVRRKLINEIAGRRPATRLALGSPSAP
jgi:Protein of unknown function (DUF1194)